MSKNFRSKKFHKTERSNKESSEGPVKAKKHLGQHFLKDEEVASKIADTLTYKGYDHVLEIGPGMGVLTKYLLQKPHRCARDRDRYRKRGLSR